MIKILKSGFYTSVQDQGRLGFAQYGVPSSGVMDQYASKFANQLLGNAKDAAVLEMTMIGAELQFLTATRIAIAGADMGATINGKAVAMFKSIKIHKNDILSFRQAKDGFRTYVAVRGGILAPQVLGSRSMLKGLTDDFKLNTGEQLHIENELTLKSAKYARLKFYGSYLQTKTLDVFKGPEFEKLTPSQVDELLQSDYQVSKFNSRMAYQLQPLIQNDLEPILTGPVLPGTVQLTPLGQLLVLMRDCQTTGGYPRVLQLTEKAIHILSQKTTADDLMFRLVAF